MKEPPALTSEPETRASWKPADGWRWDRNTTHNARHLYPILLFARLVPKPVNHLLAKALGAVLAYAMRKTRKVVWHNIERVSRGSLEAGTVRRSVRRTFQNYACYLVDFMDLVFRNPERIAGQITHAGGDDPFREIAAQGRGAILVTPHLSHWELGGILLAREGYPVNVTGFVIPDAWTNAVRDKARKRLGLIRLHMDGSGSALSQLPLLQALRNNEFVAMLTDRDTTSKSCEVDFFDGRLRMPTGAAVLAWVTGAPILPAYVTRRGYGRYTAGVEPPIRPDDFRHLDRDEAIESMTAEVARAFERIIEPNVEEWYNFYPDWISEHDSCKEGDR